MYAEILINHLYSKIKETFTYEIPENSDVKIGDCVMVPFGKKQKAAIILGLHNKKPDFDTKYIEENLSANIFLYDWQMKLADWMTDYYFCSRLDVIKLLLPSSIWKKTQRKSGLKTKINGNKVKTNHHPTTEQSDIVETIINQDIPSSLIFGVTGSGKTEVYKKLIQNVTASGKQALLLVPEISLTPQFVKYFEGSFKNLAVVHSKISEGKRAEQWKAVHKGEISLVIGSRSAIFSPFKNLGLIVIDEEHEWTYKQEQSPRYNTRDVAFKIQKLTAAKLVFGSATPSLEIMNKAKNGEIKLFEMRERIQSTPLPKVEIVDMREELKKRNFTMFSDLLIDKIKEKLDKKEQILLFLNRRGSASSTVCRDCGYVAKCKNCDTRLTYHISKFAQATLICHHCGNITKLPDSCPTCRSVRIKHFGAGTEKIENELKKLFPAARIVRADRDTMSKRNSFDDLHAQLNAKEIDILIGTQMIGKGIDIADISLVGVILADTSLHIPDFRAEERTYQLLSQVAGRAGRRDKQGEVIIQTYCPDNTVLQAVKDHNYDEFYEQEICARLNGKLPPFRKILKLIYCDKDKNLCAQKAETLLKNLKNENYEIFAAPAMLSRMNNKYFWHIYIYGEDPLTLIKKIDQTLLEGWRIDVDPIQTV